MQNNNPDQNNPEGRLSLAEDAKSRRRKNTKAAVVAVSTVPILVAVNSYPGLVQQAIDLPREDIWRLSIAYSAAVLSIACYYFKPDF